jgi:uncharacterized membrane protein
MLMLLQILAAVLLLLGSGLIFYALLSLERGAPPLVPRAPRAVTPVADDHELPRAA